MNEINLHSTPNEPHFEIKFFSLVILRANSKLGAGCIMAMYFVAAALVLTFMLLQFL